MVVTTVQEVLKVALEAIRADHSSGTENTPADLVEAWGANLGDQENEEVVEDGKREDDTPADRQYSYSIYRASCQDAS